MASQAFYLDSGDKNPLKPLETFSFSNDTFELHANSMPSNMPHFLVTDMDGWIYACRGTNFQGGTSGITISGILTGKARLPPNQEK